MDSALRIAEKAYAAYPTHANKQQLEQEQRRAGWVERYVACKQCNPETRCVGKGRNVMLCPNCCGDGWTDIVLVPPEDV